MRGNSAELAILVADLWSLVVFAAIRPQRDSSFSESTNSERRVDPKVRANSRGIYNVQPWVAEQSVIGIDNPCLRTISHDAPTQYVGSNGCVEQCFVNSPHSISID